MSAENGDRPRRRPRRRRRQEDEAQEEEEVQVPEELAPVLARLADQFADLDPPKYRHSDAFVELEVPAGRVREVAAWCRQDEVVATDAISCISGIDWQDHLQVLYHLYGLESRVKLMLRVRVERQDGDEEDPALLPRIPSVTPLWPGANWLEREVYDMFGIVFEDHPDPRRILMPDGYDAGYPLRKDFVDRRPIRRRQVRER